MEYLHKIISRNTFSHIKAVLHCQTDGDEVGKLDSAGLPMLKKIGIIFEMLRTVPRALQTW